MSRTHPLDPVIPGVTLGRATSGIAGGVVGGLLFGILMLTDFIVRQAGPDGQGMMPLVARLLGTTEPATIWAVHATLSALFGLLFSAVIAPHSYRSSILWALGYSLLLWGLGAIVLLRTLTEQPIRFDAAAAFSLIGHLLFGLALGGVYVWFHELEIREALDAQSEEWREWGERERKA